MKKFFIYATFVFLVLPQHVFSQIYKTNEACPSGMISYWKLDEFGPVNTFLDSYGGINGSSLDSTRPVQDVGIVKNARKFNGKDEITVPENSAFNWDDHTSFSIELWIKTTEPGTGNKVFIGRYEGAKKMSWWLGYNDANKVVFDLRDSSGINGGLESSKIINDGKWHHIVAVRNDNLKILLLYIDGVQDGIITTFFSGSFIGTGPIYIGYYINSYHFNGLLDEMAIYNSVLDSNLVKQHHSNGLAGKSYCDEFTTDVEENIGSQVEYVLNQNYPNPFNPSTTISFSIPNPAYVKLNVYNILGKHVSTLINDLLPPGYYKKEFKNINLPSGIYFYQLQANNFFEAKKMILQK